MPAKILQILFTTGLTFTAGSAYTADNDWLHIGGGPGGSHYSELAQLTPENVGKLQPAWTFSTGEIAEYPERRAMAGFNGTPLMLPADAGQSLVLCTPFNRIIALDPATGVERWRYDARIKMGPEGNKFLCRGIAYWQDSTADSNSACKHRLYMGTKDLRMIAIDARDGKPCQNFGVAGEINLRPALTGDTPDLEEGDLQLSAPPIIAGDTLITGFADNSKFWRVDSPAGAVHAFDVRTGEARWQFDPIPRSADNPVAIEWTEEAMATTGGANVWTMMSVDEARGLVFLPTATAGPNNFGGYRPGDNRHANSIVALNAATGEIVWAYQIVHHDIWDLDIPSQPILVDIRKDGATIPVVIQLTKQGLIFVFHRETGVPVFPIEERPVPSVGVDGEQLSPTQPYPVMPKPLVDIGISADDAFGFFSFDRGACRDKIAQYEAGGLYQPISLKGRATLPGLSVNNWGGASYDPASNLLVLPINRAPMFLRLWVTDEIPDEVKNMPRLGPLGPPNDIGGTPYSYQVGPLLSPIMTPCTPPPWGELAAIDMNDGSVAWRRPLGTIAKLARMPLPFEWGTPLAGGPTSTAGGVTFIGASADEKFRAFDTQTGELLWETETPTAAMATPMTYSVDGRQYVVVMAGGHLFMYSQNIADTLVAYALPVEAAKN